MSERGEWERPWRRKLMCCCERVDVSVERVVQQARHTPRRGMDVGEGVVWGRAAGLPEKASTSNSAQQHHEPQRRDAARSSPTPTPPMAGSLQMLTMHARSGPAPTGGISNQRSWGVGGLLAMVVTFITVLARVIALDHRDDRHHARARWQSLCSVSLSPPHVPRPPRLPRPPRAAPRAHAARRLR